MPPQNHPLLRHPLRTRIDAVIAPIAHRQPRQETRHLRRLPQAPPEPLRKMDRRRRRRRGILLLAKRLHPRVDVHAQPALRNRHPARLDDPPVRVALGRVPHLEPFGGDIDGVHADAAGLGTVPVGPGFHVHHAQPGDDFRRLRIPPREPNGHVPGPVPVVVGVPGTRG